MTSEVSNDNSKLMKGNGREIDLVPLPIKKCLFGTDEKFFHNTEGIFRVNSSLRQIAEGENLYFSTREVPSCLIMKGMSHTQTSAEVETLKSFNFDLQARSKKKRGSFTHWKTYVYEKEDLENPSGISSGQKTFLTSLLSKIAEENQGFLYAENPNFSILPETIFEGNEQDWNLENLLQGNLDTSESEFTTIGDEFRIDYGNFFEKLAAIELRRSMGLKPHKTYVWEGDLFRLSDPLKRSCLGPSFNGRFGRKTSFVKLARTDVQMHVIRHYTHWGNRLYEYRFSEDQNLRRFARRVWSMITSFLDCKGNPSWTPEQEKLFYGENRTKPFKATRSGRFLQVLVTIDGIFLQKLLSAPELLRTWESFDNFVIGLLWLLLPEEFHDGEINRYTVDNVKSSYAELKDIRKRFKDFSDRGEISTLLEELKAKDASPLMRIFRPEWKYYSEIEERFSELKVRATLSQTRGCGTPTPLVVIKSKEKTLLKLSEPYPAFKKSEMRFLSRMIDKLFVSLPDDAFTGLSTKAGINISSSAVYEANRAEGGVAQAIHEIVVEARFGRRAEIRDLNTGLILGSKSLEECESIGEYIFWVSLEEVITMQPEDVSRCTLVTANAPAKARIVTKSRVCRKFVLDTINGICSWALGKAVESSQTGLFKDNHGWEFFKDLFHEELIFRRESLSEIKISEQKSFLTEKFKCVYVSSSDAKNATDNPSHEVAGMIGEKWMVKCGIPPFLRGIVHRTCFCERIVEFTGGGILQELGEPLRDVSRGKGKREKEVKIRFILMKRGVLQGDPLTKVILHFLGVIPRFIAKEITTSADKESFARAQWVFE